MFGKRGSAVLDAPEETYAPEAEWTAPEPAPPGTLHHARDPGPAFSSDSRDPRLDMYGTPGRRRYRLRVGVPGSTAGKVALAAGAVFLLGVLGAALLAARWSVLHDERFVMASASAVQIEGNHRLTRAQVLQVFSADLGGNIFNAPLAQRQADLERLPWVAHATVMRLLPDHIRVEIAERTPVAFVRQGNRIGLIDAGGVMLDLPQDAAGETHYSFPVLTGISAGDPLSTRAARMEIYRQFMQALDSSGEKVTQSISEVDVSDPEDVKALIASGSTDILVHFGYEDFLQRYRLFQQNLPQWKTQYPKLAAVDTRYEHQLVLEMAQGTPTPLAGTDAAVAAAPAKGKAAIAAAKHPAAKTRGKVPVPEKAHPPSPAHGDAPHTKGSAVRVTP